MQSSECNADAASRNVRAKLDIPALVGFFARHARDLPWRHSDTDAWGVLISEVMLQQTPVVRVLPAYLEWMRRWPTPQALASAPTHDVIRAWGRLGYPRRALRLQEAAAAITADHGGVVPDDLDALLALPGIGEYTARAVLAFAFRRRVPVVDTNIRRVLSRAVRGVDEHGPAAASDRRELETLLPPEPERAAEACAALMEVGALICTATSPDCAHCPIAASCAWRADGYPPGPGRRRPAQRWLGTDRKMRGEIMAVLRGALTPLPTVDLAARTPSYHANEAQWDRCLRTLIDDGLAVATDRGIALP